LLLKGAAPFAKNSLNGSGGRGVQLETGTASFLEGKATMIVGIVGADGAPVATRAWALEVLDPAAGRVRIALDAADAEPFAHLAGGGMLALTSADVPTLDSRQVKGRVDRFEPVTDHDLERVDIHAHRVFTDISIVDRIPYDLIARIKPRSFVACELTVDEIYDQTPGPGAGAAIDGVEPVPSAADGSASVGAVGQPPPGPVDDIPRRVELPIDVSVMQPCFEGAVPAVIATASAAGVPNVTFLSRVRAVDTDHVALSNQFFSKTSRNLAENPQASMVIIDPTGYDEYRLQLAWERTERRGPVFDRLREDVDAVASLHGMEGVYKLRSADVYRVLSMELWPAFVRHDLPAPPPRREALDAALDAERLSELTRRLSRSPDLDTLVGATVDGLADLFGYEHCTLLLADERHERLYTIASHGYDAQGVGSEVTVGEGIIGIAASRCRPIRVGNLRQMAKYSASVRRAIERHEGVVAGREIPMPGLVDAQSLLAVPAQALGELVGVLVVESSQNVAFDDTDEHRLAVVAALVANAVEVERGRARADTATAPLPPGAQPGAAEATAARVRFFPVDGSTFLEGDYLIKGVAGRILWALLQAHAADGRTEFTNREVRLDPSLELPEFRDNFESRLILLKRRLDERDAPVRIEKTGRGRFRLVVTTPLRLESVD
jgi:adenylate cyclase